MAIESPTVSCIDDRPQVLMLRKATLKAYGYYVKARIERLHSDKDVGENAGCRGCIGTNRKAWTRRPSPATSGAPHSASSSRIHPITYSSTNHRIRSGTSE
jgi:hypothetical protein